MGVFEQVGIQLGWQADLPLMIVFVQVGSCRKFIQIAEFFGNCLKFQNF